MDLIDSLGGTLAVAKLCGLDKSSVSKWRRRGIPESWRRYLRTLPRAKKNGKTKAT